MKEITLSLNPTYLCNFRCSFCYLTPEQLADSRKLDLTRLDELLKDLSESGVKIKHVDLYGGEVGLLTKEYLRELDEILLKWGDPQVNVVTNLSRIHEYFLEDHVDLSVSFDFEARESHEVVLKNILGLKKKVSILMLASPELLSKDVDEMISFFNSIKNITSVEVKPYSSNQSNQLVVSDVEFESFIMKWITSEVSKKFRFVNRDHLEASLKQERSSFSNDHVYITPTGKFAVLEFDQYDREFFLELNHFSDYLKWAKAEESRVRANIFCQACKFLGHCLTEHYREVKSIKNSCNGYQRLLSWYAEEQMPRIEK